jgi:hypothetical protein
VDPQHWLRLFPGSLLTGREKQTEFPGPLLKGLKKKLRVILSVYRFYSNTVHRKKKVREFPVRSRDVTTKLSLGGNNDIITELFLPRGSLVSDIPAGDGKFVNLFLRFGNFRYSVM